MMQVELTPVGDESWGLLRVVSCTKLMFDVWWHQSEYKTKKNKKTFKLLSQKDFVSRRLFISRTNMWDSSDWRSTNSGMWRRGLSEQSSSLFVVLCRTQDGYHPGGVPSEVEQLQASGWPFRNCVWPDATDDSSELRAWIQVNRRKGNQSHVVFGKVPPQTTRWMVYGYQRWNCHGQRHASWWHGPQFLSITDFGLSGVAKHSKTRWLRIIHGLRNVLLWPQGCLLYWITAVVLCFFI